LHVFLENNKEFVAPAETFRGAMRVQLEVEDDIDVPCDDDSAKGESGRLWHCVIGFPKGS
jgi:hypothetical protein